MSKLLVNSKKAQGLSLNTIIIAIIVLVVLVVLVMIFTGYFGKIFTPGVQSCIARGGTCTTTCDAAKDDRVLIPADAGDIKAAHNAGCTGNTEICCRKAQSFSSGSQI